MRRFSLAHLRCEKLLFICKGIGDPLRVENKQLLPSRITMSPPRSEDDMWRGSGTKAVQPCIGAFELRKVISSGGSSTFLIGQTGPM